MDTRIVFGLIALNALVVVLMLAARSEHPVGPRYARIADRSGADGPGVLDVHVRATPAEAVALAALAAVDALILALVWGSCVALPTVLAALIAATAAGLNIGARITALIDARLAGAGR